MNNSIIHEKIRTAFFLILFSLFAIPYAHADAYLTTDQEAILLTNQTGLFLIEYSFGVRSHDIELPIMAHMGTGSSTSDVSYSIIDEDGDEVAGIATGIVLSNAEITNDTIYMIPKGVREKFTLAVLFTPSVVDSHKKYRLQVNYLPFKFDGSQQLQLNPSELQYYTTELIGL